MTFGVIDRSTIGHLERDRILAVVPLGRGVLEGRRIDHKRSAVRVRCEDALRLGNDRGVAV